MELTEKWLGEIGGWAAMKAARGLADAGLAAVQTAEPGLVRGAAGGGKTKFACGLRIRSQSDVDNLCTCPTARRGMICEHSLAVALMTTRGPVVKPSAAVQARPGTSPASSVPRQVKPAQAKGSYEVFLPEAILSGLAREPLAVFVKFAPGGEGEKSQLAGWLEANGMAERNSPLSLRGDDTEGFLRSLQGHPRVVAGRPSGGGRAVQCAECPLQMPMLISESGPDRVALQLTDTGAHPMGGGGLQRWWVSNETVTLFALPELSVELRKLLAELTRGERTHRSFRWLVEQRGPLSDVFGITLQGSLLERFHVTPVPCRFRLLLDGSLQVVEGRLEAEFQGRQWPVSNQNRVSDANMFPIQDETTPSIFYTQNIDGESRCVRVLESLGFVAVDGLSWRMTGIDKVMRFYASDLPRLRGMLEIREGEKWRGATRGVARIVPVVRNEEDVTKASASSGGWLTMEFSYQAADGFRLPRAEVLRLVRSGQRMIQAKNGKRYLIDAQAAEEFEETLRDVPVQLTAEGARINPLHAAYFVPEEGAASVLALRPESELRPVLGSLADTLRSYQMTGVRWIETLVRLGRGGLLGDEMGLGKTVQSIAAVVVGRQSGGPPVLVVCPKSLVGNWRAEFARFAPGLKVSAIQGTARTLMLAEITANDVVITTYQLIVRDFEHYRPIEFALAILDEASYIRNPDTDAAKTVRQLNARARLALTGTPVENSTRDLWSIYQFALPGYLGSRENFKERFETPIHNNLDTPAGQAASERLKKLIRPYFLRRTKKEVVRELPDKIEQVLWCDPSAAQAEVYRRLLEEGREEIKAARKRSGQGGAKMTMFTVLLRLRQACCDLRLTGLSAEALQGLDRDDLSGKWAMWSERLEEILEGGGKLLIFSQFVQYLRLVRDNLESLNVKYAYLDGSSQDRDAQVRAFQTDPEKRVFVISLKAGGYGLNLTAADHVMLMDPWWNPAVEAQAIDRAHRIGQQRVVTAYRLAVRGTVEERILALQARKRGLVEAALDEQSPLMTGLQDADLEGLLRSD